LSGFSLFGRLSALSLFLPLALNAQELREHSTPFSVWLDFAKLAQPETPKIALPIWLDSLHSDSIEGADGAVLKTTIRLRFRQLGDLNREMLLRLFFDDLAAASPVVSGWSDKQTRLFEHGPFGAGLDLPDSARLVLPMKGVSYIEIEVPGDGSNLRGAFLTSLQRAESLHSLDFAAAAKLADPFTPLLLNLPPTDDSSLLGRVRATIDAGVVKLSPRGLTQQTWEFELAAEPLLGVVTFEILNADPLAPLEVSVNDQPLGVASVHSPDLADPGYQSVARPLDRGVRFRYAGWLQAQAVIPGSALRVGPNKIVLRLPGESGAVAVRAVELQLKGQP
jgi:hypothetical protein